MQKGDIKLASDAKGAFFRKADYFLQPFFCLSQKIFVEDPDAAREQGIYSANEWSGTRQIRTAPFSAENDRYGTEENYLNYISSIQESKILPVLSLMGSFDFGNYGRIIELGCGDMPQSYVIYSHFPKICYTATDFDPHVIEQCSRLPLLAGIRKFILDVVHDDLEEFRNYDLVMSWSLEDSLEDSQLVRLFAACRKHRVPYLLCSQTTIGPLGYLIRMHVQTRQRNRMKNVRMRMIGRLRSVGEIVRLAKQASMKLKSKSYHFNNAILLFVP